MRMTTARMILKVFFFLTSWLVVDIQGQVTALSSKLNYTQSHHYKEKMDRKELERKLNNNNINEYKHTLSEHRKSSSRQFKSNSNTASASVSARASANLRNNKFGVTNERTPRIVGGERAPRNGVYDFFVYWNDQGCAASLIAENILLTAAHCGIGVGEYNPTVYIGLTDIDDRDKNDNINNINIGKDKEDKEMQKQNKLDTPIKRTIVASSIHPLYHMLTQEYDIMLLVIDEPVTGITPVTLNRDPNYPPATSTLKVIGFGVTEFNIGSDELLEVDVPYVSYQDCKEAYAHDGLGLSEHTVLCAGEEGKDSCLGDSGGPLLDQNMVQVGIVSWGDGCGQADLPGVNTRISTMIDWIDEQICLLHDSTRTTSALPENCPQTTIPIQLEITYDIFPSETGYRVIQHANNGNVNDDKILLHMPPDTMFLRNAVSTQKMNLEPGNYTFEIVDADGDGTCCLHGNGNAKIIAPTASSTSSSIFVSGGFEFLDRVHFTVNDDGSILERQLSPTMEATYAKAMSTTDLTLVAFGVYQPDPHVLIVVDIMYDLFPEEVSWMLIDTTTWEQKFIQPYGTKGINYLQTTVFPVPAGTIETNSTYWLLMVDEADDGTCCTFGAGWYETRVIDPVTGNISKASSAKGFYRGKAEVFIDA